MDQPVRSTWIQKRSRIASLTVTTETEDTEKEHHQLPLVEIIPSDDRSTQEEVDGGLEDERHSRTV